MINLLITGSNGFIGRNLLKYLAQTKRYAIHATSRTNDAYPAEGYTFHPCDLTDERQVQELLSLVQPDLIIHTAALSAIEACEANPKQAYQLNVESVRWLTDWCQSHSAKLIQLSTDFVFQGDVYLPYKETDTPNPVNVYGQTKWEAEQYIQAHLANFAIVRVVVVYGKPLLGQHTNIVELIRAKYEANETIELASDQWRTPTYVGDVSQGIEQIIERKATGIYHLCGPEEMSIYDMGAYIAKMLGIEQAPLQPVQSFPMDHTPKRPYYTALSINKARKELDYQPIKLKAYLGKK